MRPRYMKIFKRKEKKMTNKRKRISFLGNANLICKRKYFSLISIKFSS